MQLSRAVCYWFPWRVCKINIKVCDRRVAYWFKRSQGYSHSVSTFDLRPVFMFFDNTADWGCGCGWAEETLGLPPLLTDRPIVLPPPQFTVSQLPRTSLTWNTVPACNDGSRWWHIHFSAHEQEILAAAWKFTAQVGRFIVTYSKHSSCIIWLIQHCVVRYTHALIKWFNQFP